MALLLIILVLELILSDARSFVFIIYCVYEKLIIVKFKTGL